MKAIFILIPLIFVAGCIGNDSYQDVGDIPFDAATDDDSFEICNEKNIKQYYSRYSANTSAGYQGEKRTLEDEVMSRYKFPHSETQNGYFTVRFIVNCRGESGRFRTEEMNFAYKPFKFDPKISEQLTEIVKGLNGWIPRKGRSRNYDFYQYLTFKIENGQIVKILP